MPGPGVLQATGCRPDTWLKIEIRFPKSRFYFFLLLISDRP
jgi:hypothetical protein